MRGAVFVATLLASAIAPPTLADTSAPAAPHYDIQLALDPQAGTIDADVELRLPSLGAAPAAFLLGRSYVVDRAEADGGATVSVSAPAEAPGAPQTIVVSRAAPSHAPVNVTLHYAGPVPQGVNAVSADRVELSADALWYPLSTNFNARVTFQARLHGLPRDFVIASPDRVRRRGAQVTIRRTQPSQDIAFYAAPGLRGVNRERLHFYARNPDGQQTRNYTTNGPQAFNFIENLLGPCPRDRIAVVVADRASGVGYSRPGYVVVANVATEIAPDNLWAISGYIAHEISHAWWSNADFIGEDYWLVESTAEYTALRFIEAQYGVEARQGLLDGKQERARTGGAILGHGRPSDNAVYARGPILLFELETEIGRPALDRVLRNIAQRPHATTADFLAALAAESSPETAAPFEARLRAS